MKRIVFLVCGMLFLAANTAEARWYWSTAGATYAQPVQAAPASYGYSNSYSYGPRTAQDVANLMASTGRVGHWGGNTGYEGCGAGASPAAAYNNCCYANSGMATVDVGYARGANGMWYCCRRYR